MRKTDMYMSCLLICCLMCKKAIEKEINFPSALCSVCGLVIGQNKEMLKHLGT